MSDNNAMLMDIYSRYDSAVANIKQYEAIKSEVWNGLHIMARNGMNAEGPWYFFKDMQHYRLLEFKGPNIGIGRFMTPLGYTIPTYQTYGMGDYTPGIELRASEGKYEVELPIDAWKMVMVKFQESTLHELRCICYGLYEIRNNGIPVLTRTGTSTRLFSGTPEQEFDLVQDELKTYWDERNNR